MFRLVLISFCIHFFLLLVVLDTFYQTIIETDLPLTSTLNNPPAKRVLLIIVDGLRAQSVFDENEYVAPFLTSIRKGKGSWGVAHGTAPTESRIGHNAVIGGFREDPRAILSAWGYYPVKYDTVFEHSTNTWCVAGEHCIEHIFARYKGKQVRIYSFHYAEKVPNGDKWSVNNFTNLLKNKNFHKDFKQPGNIFAVMLPNLDHIAHQVLREYSDEVKDVDARIKNITTIFKKMFADNATTFLVTSDHGMRYDFGHGGNSLVETSSPLVCWGAGINKDAVRKDVENIDVAPLISVLLGINFPTNSRGIVPVSYLNISLEDKYRVLLKNVHQFLHIYEKKKRRLSKKTLISREHLNVHEIRRKLMEMESANETITNEVLPKLQNLLKRVLEANEYTKLYYIYNCIFSALLGLLFWILYIFSVFSEEFSGKDGMPLPSKSFILLFLFYVACIFCALHSNIFHFIHYVFPLGSFILLISNHSKFLNIFSRHYECPPYLFIIFFLTFYISIIFGFLKREYFSSTFLLMSPLLYIFPTCGSKYAESWKHVWALLCAILSLFPSTSFNSPEKITLLILTGGVLWHLFSWYYFFEVIMKQNLHLTTCQCFIIFLQNICSLLAVTIRIYKPRLEDSFNFLIIVASAPFLLIPFSMKVSELRIYTIFLGVVPAYIIFSFPQDLLVLTIFSVLLSSYSIVETNIISYVQQNLRYLKICMIVIGFNLFCLCGIINLSDIGHPLPGWLRWSPLLSRNEWMIYEFFGFKFLIPLVLSACIFRYIVLKTGMKLKTCFLIVELFFGTMLFHITLRLRNTGSWIDMGTSMINFVIVNFFALFLILFYFMAYVLMELGFPETLNDKFVKLCNSVY